MIKQFSSVLLNADDVILPGTPVSMPLFILLLYIISGVLSLCLITICLLFSTGFLYKHKRIDIFPTNLPDTNLDDYPTSRRIIASVSAYIFFLLFPLVIDFLCFNKPSYLLLVFCGINFCLELYIIRIEVNSMGGKNSTFIKQETCFVIGTFLLLFAHRFILVFSMNLLKRGIHEILQQINTVAPPPTIYYSTFPFGKLCLFLIIEDGILITWYNVALYVHRSRKHQQKFAELVAMVIFVYSIIFASDIFTMNKEMKIVSKEPSHIKIIYPPRPDFDMEEKEENDTINE